MLRRTLAHNIPAVLDTGRKEDTQMSYIKLNGRTFDADVAISAYERNFNVVDGQNAGRTMSGLMTRDIIGTYIGHTLTVFRRGDNYAGLDAFWNYLIEHSVDDSVLLEAGRRPDDDIVSGVLYRRHAGARSCGRRRQLLGRDQRQFYPH